MTSRIFALSGLTVLAFTAALQAQAGFKYFDVTDTAVAPKLLSQTGLYSNIAAKALIADAVRFDVNSPLWSDNSAKLRWILLKKGTSVGFREKDDYWDYPDSAVFIKQFAFDSVPGDTTTRRLWETRILVNKKERAAGDTLGTLPLQDRWYGFSYKWRRSQADADLVPLDTGSNDNFPIYPNGKSQPAVLKKWHFPSQGECSKCHIQGARGEPLLHGRSVLGFFTAQLNRTNWRGNGNQLDTLFSRGVLKGTKPSAWSTAPRWYGVTDSLAPGATVDARARAFIAANCSGCHGTRGITNDAVMWAVQNYDFHEMVPAQELRYASIRRADFLQNVEPIAVKPALVVPKFPSKSLLLYRQIVRDTNAGIFTPHSRQMPPLATFEAYQPSIDLMTRWIMEMDTAVAGIHGMRPGIAATTPLLQGGLLILPAGWTDAAGARAFMTDVQGRTRELRRLGAGRYALPIEASRGVYAFRVGGRAFFRHLL